MFLIDKRALLLCCGDHFQQERLLHSKAGDLQQSLKNEIEIRQALSLGYGQVFPLQFSQDVPNRLRHPGEIPGKSAVPL